MTTDTFETLQEDAEVNSNVDQRQTQAQAVADFVSGILSTEPDANVVVLGDMNEFEFVSPVQDILGQDLQNTSFLLDEDERYSFIFEANSQQLDHILVSDNLLVDAEFDIVHVNSEFFGSPQRASDHDPLLLSLKFNIIGDLNGDGRISFRDFKLFVKAFGTFKGDRLYNEQADFNGDGKINFRDYRIFRKIFRKALRSQYRKY